MFDSPVILIEVIHLSGVLHSISSEDTILISVFLSLCLSLFLSRPRSGASIKRSLCFNQIDLVGHTHAPENVGVGLDTDSEKIVFITFCAN